MKRKIVNPIFKDSVTYIKTASESIGQVSELELTLLPGGHNPLHYHISYSETFTANEGELGIGLGKKEKKILNPGESYTVEPYNHHYFFNPTDKEIKFKIELKPGHEGFENSLRILYGLAEDGLTNKNGIPKSIQNKAIVACMGDVNLPGFYSLIFPLLNRIAKKAETSGYKQQLIDRYCI